MPDDVMRKIVRTDQRRCTSLLDLPETLITGILRCLSTREKCQAQVVCRSFREVLSNPAPGDFVWNIIDLRDSVFLKVALNELNRWLLRRMQGVLVLYHCGSAGKGRGILDEMTEEGRRDQQIALLAIPLLSALLSPEASLHLDLSWVRTNALFPAERPDFESQYWASTSAALTRLDLAVEWGKMTEEMSAVLSQLTRLERLYIHGGECGVYPEQVQAIVNLDLPLLEQLELNCFGQTSVRLKCPYLTDLALDSITLQSFSGMPSAIQKLRVNLPEGSLSLRDLLPAHSAKALEDLSIAGDWRNEDPDTFKHLCFNGKLKRLHFSTFDDLPTTFFLASWQAVPQTLQHLDLYVPQEEGIPRILEQITSLRSLHLRYSGDSYVHLERPLDPFLDMPELEELRLWSDSWDRDEVKGTGMCLWTPGALKVLALAEKRIMQMRSSHTKRAITLSYSAPFDWSPPLGPVPSFITSA